jgi:phosphate starvation-inducible PhoH-like protein
VFGPFDKHLKCLEHLFRVRFQTDGSALLVTGDAGNLAKTKCVIEQLAGLLTEGYHFSERDVERAASLVDEDVTVDLRDFFLRGSPRDSGKRTVLGSDKKLFQPKTINQRRYLDAIENHDIVFGVGPAGTGKTYLAMAEAVAFLAAKKVGRIILARPAVEAGEKLGYLPGDLQEKVNPYLTPLYDALYEMLDRERVGRLLDRGAIEIAPIAFMRGRTLTDAFVILDEAQNTTPEQMKMFLTRLGFGSKAVVTGDITQIDLSVGQTSGMVEAVSVLQSIDEISVVHFEDKDVVRHPLVRKIVRAYEASTDQNGMPRVRNRPSSSAESV